MIVGVLLFCVISLASIQPSKTLDIASDGQNSPGSQVSDNKKKSEADGQMIYDSLGNKESEENINGNGTPLLLTPIIESGNLTEAKRMSEVKSDIFLGVKSYSGFLTVNKTYNSNLFFWYFPIENQTVSESPCIIWLQGGPGSSSMDGLFEEIGPFLLKENVYLSRNPYSWLQNHSMVFIDNPVGSGYSFTNSIDGFAKDMATYSLHLKLAVIQLLQIFPELKTAPLFVAGESYGGKYAPALAMELHKVKQNGLDVNLQGIIIGSGYVEPSVLAEAPKTFYYNGLITKEDITSIQPTVDAFIDALSNNRSFDARNKSDEIFGLCLALSDQNPYNYLRDDNFPDMETDRYTKFLDQVPVRRAIHVGDTSFTSFNEVVLLSLRGEFITPVKPFYEELLNHYKVLAYCGLLDLLLPCHLNSEQYRKWKWSKSMEFINATRNVFYFNNTRSGYYKSGGHLTEVEVQGAGHYATLDNPALVQHVVTEWTHNL